MAKNPVITVSIPENRYKELLAAEEQLKATQTGKTTPVMGFQKPIETPEKPKADPMACPPALVAAIKADAKDAKTGYYKSYTGKFIIGGGLKKYGDTAKFDPKTIAKACKEYGI